MAETVFALSSGPGPCGVAVFRVSGPATRGVIESVTGQPVPEERRAVLRPVVDPANGRVIDRGLVLFCAGPRSFTGEDVAEFHLHGSLAVIRAFSAILARQAGVTAAAAGAFTERAYRNGKMGLIEVEALSDLLAAETIEQAVFAQRAAEGLCSAAQGWREDLLSALALIEASIDFSDEDDVARSIDSGSERYIGATVASLEGALAGFDRAERVRRGFRVALCGPPNAGKSSLLNALARREVAIVSPVAGTTRDVIEVHLDLGGYPVIVADTAGVRDTGDAIEAEGVRRARLAAEAADLVLWLSPCDAPASCPWPGAMVVQSKSDLVPAVCEDGIDRFISVTTGAGLDDLVATLAERAEDRCGHAEGLIVAQERQASELRSASAALGLALQRDIARPEIKAEDVRQALRHLDRLTGRIDPEEVLGAIFSRFCIGK